MKMNIQRLLIDATKPVRYKLNSASFRLQAETKALLDLKDKHAGRPMIVVGNGPSLNRTPLEEFSHVPAIGMNKIDLIYSRTNWRPELVVCLNNLVAKQHQTFFAGSDIPVFLAWKSRWLIANEHKRRVEYYNVLASNEFTGDPVRGFGASATVTYIALQMAYWMGADPVILFGVDHSFKYEGPDSTYQRRHGPDENHFDKDYFKSDTLWATPDLSQSEIEYQLARAAFDAKKRRIYDATIGGKLKVFERMKLEEVRRMLQRA